MFRLSVLFAAVLFLLLLVPGPTARPARAATELTVYTAVEVELLTPYKRSFEAAFPGITIAWTRDSGGVITSRLLAEKNAPKADVVFGLTSSGIAALQAEGLIEPYAPANLAAVSPEMRENADPPAWIAISSCPLAFCINKREAQRLGLPLPRTWEDLINPVYRGHIVMPDPASSGTAFAMIAHIIQAWGEAKAWPYFEALHQNVALYTHSGSQPAEMAAKGETAIGISQEAFTQTLIRRGAPLVTAIPHNPTPVDLELCAIIKGTPKTEAARKLMDWAASAGTADIVGPRRCLTVLTSPSTSELRETMAGGAAYDFTRAAGERDAILKRWRAMTGKNR